MDNMSLKQKEQLIYYAIDIAGNKVPVHIDYPKGESLISPYIPTIKGVMDIKNENAFEKFIKEHREPIKFETLFVPKDFKS